MPLSDGEKQLWEAAAAQMRHPSSPTASLADAELPETKPYRLPMDDHEPFELAVDVLELAERMSQRGEERGGISEEAFVGIRGLMEYVVGMDPNEQRATLQSLVSYEIIGERAIAVMSMPAGPDEDA